MLNHLIKCLAVTCCLLITSITSAGEILFEDNFNEGLSTKWELDGLKEGKDYRIKDGALELRVQSGKLKKDTPMLKVVLPFNASDTVVASVEITMVDKFTQDGEFAALYLIDEDGREFAAKKQLVNRQLMFAPGNYVFKGKPGEGDNGDINNYDVRYSPAVPAAGAVRIISDRGYAHFQVGPSKKGKYLNFFHSAINKKAKGRGFALTAVGGPDDVEHWVRFDNFKVQHR